MATGVILNVVKDLDLTLRSICSNGSSSSKRERISEVKKVGRIMLLSEANFFDDGNY
jgi:hypothetical protein